MIRQAPGSFRDPSGRVYQTENGIFRTIEEGYRPHWEAAEPFLTKLAEAGLLLPYREAEPLAGAWKTIRTERLPFVSYPYEWSHQQLRDAALLTLELQKRALRHGLILKDASAYNVQFIGARPVFIDHLSFELWEEGRPWEAYRQFCSHFVAPLALLAGVDIRCGLLSRLWIDGIPLDMAAAMLPRKMRMHPGLSFHLYLHARMQRKCAHEQEPVPREKNSRITAGYLLKFTESLERLIGSKALQPLSASTEWGDYYDNTNYSQEAARNKQAMVEDLAKEYGGGLAIDLGANTGRYTKRIAPHFTSVIAVDLDPLAVSRHYEQRKSAKDVEKILPLILDFSNPSPGIGFGNTERTSFVQRCHADFGVALALIHHLRITAGIPLPMIADFFASLLKEDAVLLLEFVPKEDSQTRRLLASRRDIFADYTLEQCKKAFASRFDCLSVMPVDGSLRQMLVFRKRKVDYA